MNTRRDFFVQLLMGSGLVLTGFSGKAADTPTQETFTLWQLPAQTHSQMMSYVIRTTGGKIIVLDGGTAGDAPYLRGFLAAQGNKVDCWLLSHPHSDHVDALTELLRNLQGLKIGDLYASMPSEESRLKNAPDDDASSIKGFNEVVKNTGIPFHDLELGASWNIDGVQIQALGIRNPELTNNFLNNSSVVFKLSDSRKSVLFLGDLGYEGGQKLLAGAHADKLPSDYVQMAHHGQNGVGESVYQAIRAKYCLWPTPLWLWDNNSGKGKDSGPWQTLKTRAWMEKLNIQRHYVSAEGLFRID